MTSVKKLVSATERARGKLDAKSVTLRSVGADFDATRLEIVASAVASGSKDYEVIIRWSAQPNSKGTEFEGYHKPLKRKLDTALVHCTCEDFRYTFWSNLNKNGIAWGRFPPTKSKGSGKVRAVNYNGCCKHIKALAQEIGDYL